MSKIIWITTGIAAAAVGLTAIVAHAEREDRGFRSQYGDDGYRDGERRRGWRREMRKEDFDAKTRERFARWDANSDNVVDAAEVEARIARRIERRFNRRGNRRLRRMLHRLDADRDGKITKQEMEARVADRFKRMDLTGDDRITDEDLPPVMRGRDFLSNGAERNRRFGRRGWRRHRGRGRRMLRALAGADTNKDGAVTLDELQIRAGKRFERFDRNKDGSIDEADRAALVKETIDYRVRRFMHRFGGDKDGTLTLAQFIKHRNERFSRLDIDGDGVLQRGELRGHRGHRDRRHWRRRDDDRRDRDD